MSTCDIFRMEADGVRWLETATTVDAAKARIQQLAKQSEKVSFVVVDHRTGNKLVFEPRVMQTP